MLRRKGNNNFAGFQNTHERTSGQVRVVNQKHCVREMLEMPTRTPRALQIMRSVPGGSGTPSGNVATPLHSHAVLGQTHGCRKFPAI